MCQKHHRAHYDTLMARKTGDGQGYAWSLLAPQAASWREARPKGSSCPCILQKGVLYSFKEKW